MKKLWYEIQGNIGKVVVLIVCKEKDHGVMVSIV